MTSTTDASKIKEQYQLPTPTAKEYNKELGQKEFLKLMTAQLKYQDPMKPMDNGDFLGQMAQFSTVTGIEKMQKSIDTLSTTYSNSQTLQSIQLVGQEVLIENDTMELGESGASGGLFELKTSAIDVTLTVQDSNGTVIRQTRLGDYAAGRSAFSWDGLNDNGKRVPAGSYTAKISAKQGDDYQSAPILTTRTIDSVEFGAGGGQTRLNTEQGDVLSLADIRQVRTGMSSSATKEATQ